MTKEVMQQALDAIHLYLWAGDKHLLQDAHEALRTTLLQPPLPVQKPVACRFCHSKKGSWTWQCYTCDEIDDVQQPALPLPVQKEQQQAQLDVITVTLMREGINKHRARELADHFVNFILKPNFSVQKPVALDKPSDSFNEWWNGDYEDPANPFEKDSAAWWAWAGWKAAQTVQEPVAWLYPEGFGALQNGKCWTAYPTKHEDCNIPLYTALPQRPWVGLTEQERNDLEDALGLVIGKPLFDAIEAKLKEHNHG